jgi:glycosyltransferase involved in cell wall biosynthesis
MHQITDRLAKNGCIVHVIQAPSLKSDEITFRERNIDFHKNIKLHTIKLDQRLWHSVRVGKVVRKGYYGFAVTQMVRRMVREFSIDVLWLYSLPHYPLSKIDDCIIVFDYLDDDIAMLNTEAKLLDNRIIELIEEAFLRKLLRRADIVFSVSKVLYDHVSELVREEKGLILPNGVDLSLFSLRNSSPSVPRNIPEEKATVGFTGAFEYFIDFDMIFEAARRLSKVQFLLVGGGREYNRLVKLKENEDLNNIHFAGVVASEEVPQYISRMDICLNSFKQIRVSHAACPMKLFEYLALEKPVITSTLEAVKNIDEGFLYYADTAEELVDRIKWILGNYQKAIEKASKAKPIIVKKYNWDIIAERFANTIEKHL